MDQTKPNQARSQEGGKRNKHEHNPDRVLGFVPLAPFLTALSIAFVFGRNRVVFETVSIPPLPADIVNLRELIEIRAQLCPFAQRFVFSQPITTHE